MRRFADWETRLGEYLESVRHTPHHYGRHDCALHCANAVRAMTGEDIAALFRGRYRSAAGSLRALRLYGAGTLEATVTAMLGPPVSPSLVHRGDVVMAQDSLGIAMGGFGYFAGREGEREGLVRIDRAEWQMAWRV